MNDPRHRAPFAHHSSAIDLHDTYGAPGSPTRAQWPLAPGGPDSGHGLGLAPNGSGPPYPLGGAMSGLQAPLPGSQGLLSGPISRAASVASAASNILGGMRLDTRKTTDHLPYEGPSTPHTHRRGSASVSESLTSALPSTSTLRFIFLCTLWYASSAVSSNTGKVILSSFRYPVTLTIVQFAFVAGLCWLGSRRELNWTGRLRKPTRQILLHTAPMAAFQVGGHIFGSLAISRVPVSTVHTIKALSPCFTVLAYVVLYGVKYSPATYLSLLPLTLGVMLACSFDISLSNVFGLLCAFGSAIIFVSQNIFFKKVMPSPGSVTADSGGPRLDKVNLLYFSSGSAFLLMIPIWLYTDAGRLLTLWLGSSPTPAPAGSASLSKVLLYLFINGTVHFFQNVLAFAILSSTSPVTYSIASLVKRIAVICIAIVWFKQSVHGVQAIGIMLTALGLWMYNNAKRDVDKGEKRFRAVEAAREAARDGLLPTSLAQARVLEGRDSPEPSAILENGPIKAKGSPRPTFSADMYNVSKASALRAQYAPPPRKPQQVPVNAEPYPSPPASTASSPPFAPIHLADEPRSPVLLEGR